MTKCEQAVQDYIDYYGRIDIGDMTEFFGFDEEYSNHITRRWKRAWNIRRLRFSTLYKGTKGGTKYRVEFPKLKEISRFLFEKGFKHVTQVCYELRHNK